MAFCELYTETFERGACEACSLVVHSRTFPSARARSRSKFTKVRSKKLNSFESNSSSHIFLTLKLSRSLWKQLMGECSCARVCSRAVFVNELQIFVVYILSVVFHFCWWPKTPFDLMCHPVIHLQREVASFIAQIIETVNVKCKCPAKQHLPFQAGKSRCLLSSIKKLLAVLSSLVMDFTVDENYRIKYHYARSFFLSLHTDWFWHGSKVTVKVSKI